MPRLENARACRMQVIETPLFVLKPSWLVKINQSKTV